MDRMPNFPEAGSPQTRGIRIGNQVIGGSSITWIAGPELVESSTQMVSVGASLEALGVKFLRAGTHTPGAKRTETYGLNGLKLLRATAKRYGLHVVSEIQDPKSFELLAEYCDLIEVRLDGAQSPELLRELAHMNKPVIVHRDPEKTVRECLESVEILARRGRSGVVVADGGMTNPCVGAAPLLDLSTIITLKRETPYPVLVDCSSVAADPLFADQLAVAAVAAGADGIMVDLLSSVQGVSREGAGAVFPYQLASMIKRIEALKFTLNALLHKNFEELGDIARLSSR